MSCSNCFNGCTEIVSDQCVKYTGIDVPVLGIQTGDSLSYVEQALITFLSSTLDGTGIIPNINTGTSGISCNLVSQYLPVCGEITIVDLVSALIQASCDLQTQVDSVVAELAILNGDYTIDCLTGVSVSSGTHIILQAVIDNLCSLNLDVVALALDLATNYVKIADIDAYIAAWMAANNSSSLISSKMIPYVAVPYFGVLTPFNGTGAGTGNWINIYLCNGENGTPDLRGRTVVGVTNMLGGIPLDPSVISPIYTPRVKKGDNIITLSALQMPSHTHTASTVTTQASHFHFTFNTDASGAGAPTVLSTTYPTAIHDLETGYSYRITGSAVSPTLGRTSTETPIITSTTINTNAGSSQSHDNIQPSMGAYYIIYLP